VNREAGADVHAAPGGEAATPHHERLLERMIDRLPGRLQFMIRRLRQPSLRWVRFLAGILLIVCSFLSILPVFGLWMLPLGLLLLAEDIAPLRRVRDRLLSWIERHRPHWFAGSSADGKTPSIAGRPSSAGPRQ
jgi:hypothetical protein